jgi:hypothetical protein
MAETGAWSTLTQDDILVTGDNILSMIAGEALVAGQVVGHAATGDGKAYAMDLTEGENAVGVALFSASSGDPVSIATVGCVVRMREGTGNAIDAGDWLEQDDNAAQGMVKTFAPRADLASTVIDGTNDTTIEETTQLVGMAQEDIAANGEGRCLIILAPVLWSDHAVVG